MKYGDRVLGTVKRFLKDGRAEIDSGGRPLRVHGAIPGEEIEATVAKRIKHAFLGRLETIVTPSPDRVVPRCPYAAQCGGCAWQHVDYPRQLAEKLTAITEGFAAAGLPPPEDITPSPEIFYYRNRMDFVFGPSGELGLKEPGRWWSALDLSVCFLLSSESVEIMKRVREWSRASGLPFWNAKTQTGFFRYLVIREGKNTGERMVMLVSARPAGPQAQEVMKALPDILGDSATSVVWGINPLVTDLSVAEEIIPLKWNPWIHEGVNGIRYKITPNAFFQTNTAMAAKLQETVKEFCGNLSDKTLLDLYCGSGFFSLFLAMEAKRTIGIELSEEAIAAAKENAAANGISGVEFFASKAEDFDWSGYQPDVVILDPPRSGLHPKALKAVIDAKPPALVYVSCNWRSLAQEAEALLPHYALERSVALDLFPHTPHVEVVTRWTKRP